MTVVDWISNPIFFTTTPVSSSTCFLCFLIQSVIKLLHQQQQSQGTRFNSKNASDSKKNKELNKPCLRLFTSRLYTSTIDIFSFGVIISWPILAQFPFSFSLFFNVSQAERLDVQKYKKKIQWRAIFCTHSLT
ncbi:hypothetical protein J3Q64DRAFT_1723893 [Phycomyces blakesleeanus]|uniref:Uncharacterized protein n=1 Tax=Phycomyces blakesleeanus TaxID=4837 RepID=A0ABR3B764_PHYBL